MCGNHLCACDRMERVDSYALYSDVSFDDRMTLDGTRIAVGEEWMETGSTFSRVC